MESHPVPQNVTSFEFHLVGDMTLKQFGYLAAGLTTAYILYIFFASLSPYVVYPLMVTSAGLGAAFAFLPIMERPLDHWFMAFLRAIFNPTQREFRSKQLKVTGPIFPNRLTLYLNTISSTPAVPVTNYSQPPVSQLKPQLSPSSQTIPRVSQPTPQLRPIPASLPQDLKLNKPTPPIQKPPVPPQNTPQPLRDDQLNQRAKVVTSEINQTVERLGQIKAQAASPGEKPEKFNEDFQLVLAELQNLNKEASEISKELIKSNPKTNVPSPEIKIIPTIQKQPQNFPVLTSTPNAINGVVTDTLGNYLEGAIVIAHDAQDIPVRALKTNKLGQFIVATPLPNGVYILTAEKDNLRFDTLQIELKGSVLPPLIIRAKKGGA